MRTGGLLGRLLQRRTSNEEPHWTTWEPAKREVWVREPPPFAIWMGEMQYPAPGDAIARLWGPEHDKVAELLDLRCYESRARMYGLISSGSYIARGPAPHVDKVWPIYDWRDRDVWLAIHPKGWALNEVYGRMWRFRPNPKQLRMAVPTSIEAMNLWADWQVLHPRW